MAYNRWVLYGHMWKNVSELADREESTEGGDSMSKVFTYFPQQVLPSFNCPH